MPRGHVLTPQQRLHRLTTEDVLQGKMLDLAYRRGWWFHHTRPVWTKKGFRSPLGGMKGFPDWVLARPGRDVITAGIVGSDEDIERLQQALNMLAADLTVTRDPLRIHRSQVLFVELKQELGKLEPEQEEWRRRLEPTGLYRLWRPSDWPAMERELM